MCAYARDGKLDGAHYIYARHAYRERAHAFCSPQDARGPVGWLACGWLLMHADDAAVCGYCFFLLSPSFISVSLCLSLCAQTGLPVLQLHAEFLRVCCVYAVCFICERIGYL